AAQRGKDRKCGLVTQLQREPPHKMHRLLIVEYRAIKHNSARAAVRKFCLCRTTREGGAGVAKKLMGPGALNGKESLWIGKNGAVRMPSGKGALPHEPCRTAVLMHLAGIVGCHANIGSGRGAEVED